MPVTVSSMAAHYVYMSLYTFFMLCRRNEMPDAVGFSVSNITVTTGMRQLLGNRAPAYSVHVQCT